MLWMLTIINFSYKIAMTERQQWDIQKFKLLSANLRQSSFRGGIHKTIMAEVKWIISRNALWIRLRTSGHFLLLRKKVAKTNKESETLHWLVLKFISKKHIWQSFYLTTTMYSIKNPTVRVNKLQFLEVWNWYFISTCL